MNNSASSKCDLIVRSKNSYNVRKSFKKNKDKMRLKDRESLKLSRRKRSKNVA